MSSSSKGLSIGGSGGKGGGGTPVAMELEKLGVEQIKAVKEQADMEVNLLQDSLNNIRNATARLDIASNALHDLSLRPQGSELFLVFFFFFLNLYFCRRIWNFFRDFVSFTHLCYIFIWLIFTY